MTTSFVEILFQILLGVICFAMIKPIVSIVREMWADAWVMNGWERWGSLGCAVLGWLFASILVLIVLMMTYLVLRALFFL